MSQLRFQSSLPALNLKVIPPYTQSAAATSTAMAGMTPPGTAKLFDLTSAPPTAALSPAGPQLTAQLRTGAYIPLVGLGTWSVHGALGLAL